MLVSLLDEKSSKQQIRSHYSNFTHVERVMVDRGYAWNDNDYPSTYWKILAGIYYIINKKDMCRIDLSYSTSVFDNESTRIRSSSETEQNKIRSIYDIYINFKFAYKPFRRNNIDIKLSKLGYPLEFLTSIKDKLILFIKDFAVQNKLHPVEKELCNNVSFLQVINFMSFYDTLLSYVYEPINYVFESPDYSQLYHMSDIFKKEREKEIISDLRVLSKIAKTFFNEDSTRVVIGLKNLLLGNFFIRTDDIIIMMFFCRFFFNKDISIQYINDLMIVMKYKGISPSILMMFDKELSFSYSMIDISLKNIAKYSAKLDIMLLPINEYNYIEIAGNCNNAERFKSVIRFSKENGWPIDQCINLFIRKMINVGFMGFGDIRDIDPNVIVIIMENRYEILASHIRMCRLDFIVDSLTSVKDWDLYDRRLIEATGESCNVQVLETVYGLGPHTDEFINIVVLSCYHKGSTVFSDYFSQSIFSVVSLFHKSVKGVTDNEIVDAIVTSNNVQLIEKFRHGINVTNIDSMIVKTIVKNNFSMFLYFIKTFDRKYLNIRSLTLCAAINKRRLMLICLMDDQNNDENKENISHISQSSIDESKNQFFLSILKQCVTCVTPDILNVFFTKITYDYNDKNIQLFVIRDVIIKIIQGSNRSWLEENLILLPIFYLDFKRKRPKMFDIYKNHLYISSDEESDFDDI